MSAAKNSSEAQSAGSQSFCGRTRREFLWETGAGFTGIALSALLQRDGYFAQAAESSAPPAYVNPLSAKVAPLMARAKRCIFLFMYGGPSQMDTFDYKPELQKRDKKTVKIEIRRDSFRDQVLQASKRNFARHGESGLWCSDAFPNIAKHVDKLTVIKSLYMDSFAHGSALLQMNSGRIIQGHPCLGSWVSYGLGTVNENLPSFVVMLDPRGGPISGAANWMSGYMPAVYQGTVLRSTGRPILNLAPAREVSVDAQREQLQAINHLNAQHLATHPGYSELQARISSYELAFQLQSTAPEALAIDQESLDTQTLYGLHDPKPEHKLSLGPVPFGRQCLIARRLLERGVRFVQIYHGGGHNDQNWDAHSDVDNNLKIHGPEIDRPIAGLLADLQRRGMLEDTLVIWGGEFGRQPVTQNGSGRDHNPKGFCYWMAGGGVKTGFSYGETDEIGHEAVTNRHHIRDLHATILHLMGFDPQKLTYFFGGLDNRLTGVQGGEIIQGVLA